MGAEESAARRRVLVLEPYHGGSHRAVLDTLIPALEPLGWDADLLTLPARKWKWRMRGAGITMADEARGLAAAWREAGRPGARWDVIFASTFLNLAEFLALAGDAVAGVPSVLYFHENQLLYPNRHEAEWDLQFPLTNVTSALAATACWFNTRWNLDGFLSEIPGFMRRFPDHVPHGLDERIAAKSRVIPPPFDPTPFDDAPPERGERCRIAWPHRWEHDKAPDEFFDAVTRLAEEGLDFEVVVAGKSFSETREQFEAAGRRLGGRLVHLGAPARRDEYAALLATCDVAVSTARNEFFGLAMIESAYAGCYPLVPDRLAYPEIYAGEMRYRDADELLARLRAAILERPAPNMARDVAEPFSILRLSSVYASQLRDVARFAEGERGR